MGYYEIKKHYETLSGSGGFLCEYPEDEIIVTLETGDGVSPENIFKDEEYGIPFVEAKDNRLVLTYFTQS